MNPLDWPPNPIFFLNKNQIDTSHEISRMFCPYMRHSCANLLTVATIELLTTDIIMNDRQDGRRLAPHNTSSLSPVGQYAHLKGKYPLSVTKLAIHPLEGSISLALHEGSLPRHALRVLRQLGVVLSMGRAIDCHTLELTIRVTFISVEESVSLVLVDAITCWCV
jgi:hypothetical protein